uniref:Uncharacterized protein n=1 Tax=Ascaris lumbricoides TaxID=6252 RepID=A0A9J2Q3C7_ASCLU
MSLMITAIRANTEEIHRKFLNSGLTTPKKNAAAFVFSSRTITTVNYRMVHTVLLFT